MPINPTEVPRSELFLPAEKLREVNLRAEFLESIDLALGLVQQPQDETGILPIERTTVMEISRGRQELADMIDRTVSSATPQQQQEFDRLAELRRAAQEKHEAAFARDFQEATGEDWFEPADTRIARRNAPQKEQAPSSNWIVLEIVRLSRDHHALLDTHNTLFDNPYSHESHFGTTPLSSEADADLKRYSNELGKQRAAIYQRLTPEQRKLRSDMSEAYWASRRQATGEFARNFEDETGEPYYPPLPEPKKDEPEAKPAKKRNEAYTRNCPKCGKPFTSSKSEGNCYDCALDKITHGLPPEEGDFNTAAIVSGTLTAKEAEYLQEDLRSVEEGTSVRE